MFVVALEIAAILLLTLFFIVVVLAAFLCLATNVGLDCQLSIEWTLIRRCFCCCRFVVVVAMLHATFRHLRFCSLAKRYFVIVAYIFVTLFIPLLRCLSFFIRSLALSISFSHCVAHILVRDVSRVAVECLRIVNC